jgi:hypothetical protein
MDSVKYIGMDVHKDAISIAALNSSGKLVMECIIETKASTILQFFQGQAEVCTSPSKKDRRSQTTCTIVRYTSAGNP